MSSPIAIRIARRELRAGLSGFRVFLACLALGVAAIAAVGTVRSSIGAGLAAEGAAMLGGDAEVGLTYRFANPEERAFLDDISDRVSETVDFRSLAGVALPDGTSDRALTQVRAVDNAYPLIGTVTLSPDIPLAEALAGTRDLPGAVMEPALADRLGLTPGDTFSLGLQEFTLSALLTHYPDNSTAGFGLGPRTIVLTENLENSGLIKEGTLFSTAYRLDLPDGADLAALEARAETELEGSGLRWRDSRDSSGAERFVERIGAFLILVGLSGLAVGGVGVSAAVRAYLSGKTGVIATLKTLGASGRTIFAVYALQIGLLAAVGIFAGLVLGGGLPVLLAPLIEARLPVPAIFAIYPRPLLEAALYGGLTAAIFTLWPLARTEQVRAAALFRDAFASGRALPAAKYIALTGLLVAALVSSAAILSGTPTLALWTFGGIAAALLALVVAAVATRAIARRAMSAARGLPALRLALGAIGARNGETVAVVLSLGLGLAVLAGIGQIDGNLRGAFSEELPEVAPSYFFVDIQPDQIGSFQERLATNLQVSKVEAAPMLRGIITEINGQPAKEVAGDHWILHGDRGVTYSAALPENTRVTEGEWWPPDYDGPPLVSFSDAEAREIGLQIGDLITVNILGRDLTATIASFREVVFQTAGIGFVMSFNPAALSGAPHSWIATVYSAPEAEGPILREMASAYPNITAFRIRDAIARMMEIVEGISAGVRVGAGVTLITGFLVLIGAAAAGEKARTFEAAILKTLGASRARILWSFALRSAILGAAAGSVALAAGISGAYAIMVFVMEGDFHVIWSNVAWIIGGGVVISTLAGLGFSLRAMSARPAQVLRAQE